MGVARFAAFFAALVSGAGPATAADEPLHMAPASKWVLDAAEDSCALRRDFQGGVHTATLRLRQVGPGHRFEVMVASDTLSHRKGPVSAAFMPGEKSAIRSAQLVGSGNTYGVVYTSTLAPEGDEGADAEPKWTKADLDGRERAVTGLRLDGVFGPEIVLDTGSLHPPMEAMRVCLDDLLAQWGLDATVQRTLSRKVEPLDQEKWARAVWRGYMAAMQKMGKNALVHIRLIVGADAKPKQCTAHGEISDPAFSKEACSLLMKNAVFKPALDAEGRPVESYWLTSLNFYFAS